MCHDIPIEINDRVHELFNARSALLVVLTSEILFRRDAVTGANGQLRAVNMSSRNVLELRSHHELFDVTAARTIVQTDLRTEDATK